MATESKSDKVETSKTMSDEKEAPATVDWRFTRIMERHKELLDNYKAAKKNENDTVTKKDETKSDISGESGVTGLISFNGFYNMPSSIGYGAFFAIDTNLTISNRIVAQTTIDIIYPTLELIDGKIVALSTNTHVFDESKGDSFTNNVLTLKDGSGNIFINFTFTRLNNNNDGKVASFNGKFGNNNIWTGVTENNPIPYSVWPGSYYYHGNISVLQMRHDYGISYDYGANNGTLYDVGLYTYNLNMYVFSFHDKNDASIGIGLIMGSAGGQGLACNNMWKNKTGEIISRSLTTIQISHVTMVQSKNILEKYKNDVNKTKGRLHLMHDSVVTSSPNVNNNLLAGFSGYYQIKGEKIGTTIAFLSIQADLTYANGYVDYYNSKITISYSLNGVTSKSVKFDSTMSFVPNFDGSYTLTVPILALTVNLKREYKSDNRSLVQATNGMIELLLDNNSDDFGGIIFFNGFTHFNPVSIEAFVGNYYLPNSVNPKNPFLWLSINQNVATKQMAINYMNSIYSTGNFLYVPIMYILVFQDTNGVQGTILGSLGTDHARGNTCIVEPYASGYPTRVVYAFPNAPTTAK